MAEDVGDDESDFESVTSSQRSFLNICPFADPYSVRQALTPTESPGGIIETDSACTEVLGNPISPPVVRTPVISFSSPTSLDSINDDDVFRTPPENASLSSAADSEPRARVPEMKPASTRGGSRLTSPSSKTPKTPDSASPSLPAENVRVSERNRRCDPVELVAKATPFSSPPSVAADDVRFPEMKPASTRGDSRLKSPSSKTPGSASPSLPAENVRASETNRRSDSVEPFAKVVPLSSQPSVAADYVRVPRKHFVSDSSPTRVLENQPISASVSNTGAPKSPRAPGKHSGPGSPSPAAIGGTDVSDSKPTSQLKRPASPIANAGIKIAETENPSGEEPAIPFKQVIEALLRNNGENLNGRDEKVSYVDILKKCGLRFP